MKTARKIKAGVIHIVALLIIAVIIGAAALLSFSEKTSSTPNKAVLSQGEEGDSSGSSESSGGNSDSNSSSGSSVEKDDDDERNNTSGSSDSSGSGGTNARIETEVRYPSGVRVRTKQERDDRRVDIYEGGRHLRIRTQDGVTTVTVENEEGEELVESKLAEDEEVETKVEGDTRIRIRTINDKILLRQGLSSAQTNFPVSIDQETGELTITTPAGIKVVSVLPETAINSMLTSNVIDRVLSAFPPATSAIPKATGEGELGENIQEVEIVEDANEIKYIINGALEQKFLGLFNILVPKTAIVSAETGELLQIRQSIFDRVLDILSF